jgi:fructokinase
MTLFDGAEVIVQPAFPSEVVDTVGCGDAAMGAWMAARLSGERDRATHLLTAAATASLVAERAGPYAPLRAEVEAFVRVRTGATGFTLA